MRYFSYIQASLILVLVVLLSACSKSGSNPTPQNSTPKVTIASLSVTSGPYNTSVTITGTGFDQNGKNDSVFFNGKAVIPGFATSTELDVQVPLAAGTGNVTVKVHGTTATGPVFTYQQTEVVIDVAGYPYGPGFTNGAAASARFDQIDGIAFDKSGNLYIADQENVVIRKLTPQGIVSTFAGSGQQGRTDGTLTTATFEGPTEVAIDQSGNVYVADGGELRKITTDGNVSTITPTQNLGNFFLGTRLSIDALTIDASNNIYIIDRGNQFVGKIAPDGTLTGIVGMTVTPTLQLSPLTDPWGITLDKNGNLYISDDSRIWKIDPTNAISKYVSSSFSGARDIAVDGQGNLYVADISSKQIKKVATNGTVSIVAGNTNISPPAYGPVSQASFLGPTGIALDASGNIFLSDSNVIDEITNE